MNWVAKKSSNFSSGSGAGSVSASRRKALEGPAGYWGSGPAKFAAIVVWKADLRGFLSWEWGVSYWCVCISPNIWLMFPLARNWLFDWSAWQQVWYHISHKNLNTSMAPKPLGFLFPPGSVRWTSWPLRGGGGAFLPVKTGRKRHQDLKDVCLEEFSTHNWFGDTRGPPTDFTGAWCHPSWIACQGVVHQKTNPWNRGFQVSNEKRAPGCSLGFIGDEMLPSSVGISS